jgi:hypothetical protein
MPSGDRNQSLDEGRGALEQEVDTGALLMQAAFDHLPKSPPALLQVVLPDTG